MQNDDVQKSNAVFVIRLAKLANLCIVLMSVLVHQFNNFFGIRSVRIASLNLINTFITVHYPETLLHSSQVNICNSNFCHWIVDRKRTVHTANGKKMKRKTTALVHNSHGQSNEIIQFNINKKILFSRKIMLFFVQSKQINFMLFDSRIDILYCGSTMNEANNFNYTNEIRTTKPFETCNLFSL